MSRIEKLQSTLKQITGVEIEITVISKNEWSFMWDGNNTSVFDKLKRYFNNTALNVYCDNDVYDSECECCCVYAKL